MDYKELDMSAYARRAHFDYFRSLGYPYVGVTVNVDITDLVRKAKEEELPFFLSLCYCVAQAANAVPEFRQRIHGDGIIQYEWCQTSHTVALEDGTYCYCTLESDMSFRDYLPRAREAMNSSSTSTVTVLRPPAVEPEEPPMSINTEKIALLLSVKPA